MATRIPDIGTRGYTIDELRVLLNHLPVGAILAEVPSGRVVAANAAAERVWRSTLPHSSSVDEYNDHYTGFRADGRQYAAEEWPLSRAVRYGEVVLDEEIEFRYGDGMRRVLQVSAAPVRDDAHEIFAAVALFHDVTERRQEERRREFLMALIDRMRVLEEPVAIMEAAAETVAEQLGVTSASYADVEKGRVALVRAEYRNGRIAPESRYYLDELGARLLEQLRAGETVEVEDIFADPRVSSDALEQWGIRSAVAVPIVDDGCLTAVFAVLQDAPRRWGRCDVSLIQQVAERTYHAVETARAHAQLRQSREWLNLALRAGSAATWEWDLRSGEIRWSEEHDVLLRDTGGRRSLTFARWLALVHPDDRGAARAAARRIAAMREGEVELEYRLAGGARWITMRGHVIADARGIARRVIGIAVDTTERKGTELEREELLRQARDASEAKSHFISVISHEFRTPLTAIIGYTDLLSTGVSGELSPTQARQLDRIRASAWHLTQMVDEILTFSRIEGGREVVVPAPTDGLAVARDTAALIAPAAALKGLALACELPDEPITLRTDSGKLRQILLNLLGNAVKFTERGGVTLRVQRHADRVEYSVSDTGVGISPEHMHRIFDRFWQAHLDPGRHASGAGLGLTVSRQLAQLLDGELTVTSELGSGSTFRLTLPL